MARERLAQLGRPFAKPCLERWLKFADVARRRDVRTALEELRRAERVRLVSCDRNVVAATRSREEPRLTYLKVRLKDGTLPIEREYVACLTLKHALYPLRAVAERWAVSVNPPLVATEQAGTSSLSRLLYAALCLRFESRAVLVFSRLAQVLAAMHRTGPGTGPEAHVRVEGMLYHLPRRYRTAVTHSLGALYGNGAQMRAYIHGNLGWRNIRLSGARPVLIDFENAGIGHPYHDVGQILGQLVLASFHPMGSPKMVYRLSETFANSYLAAGGYSRNIDQWWELLGCVWACLLVGSQLRRSEQLTIGGAPIHCRRVLSILYQRLCRLLS